MPQACHLLLLILLQALHLFLRALWNLPGNAELRKREREDRSEHTGVRGAPWLNGWEVEIAIDDMALSFAPNAEQAGLVEWLAGVPEAVAKRPRTVLCPA